LASRLNVLPPNTASGEVRTVAEFVEKPDAAKAAEYIKAGYLWNSGRSFGVA
jgi:mannose-1-phosphate guanylyltransferase / mannose-6-phosphate isomerase